MKIRSYSVSIENTFELDLPKDSRILTIREQSGQPKVWVMADDTRLHQRRRFHVVRGDRDIHFNPDDCDYIGSFNAAGDVLVFHVFAERDSDLRG